MAATFSRAVLLSLLLGLLASGCRFRSDDPSRPSTPGSGETGPAAEPEKAGPEPIEIYRQTRDRILQGEFLALYDIASTAYRKVGFPVDTFREKVSENPAIADEGLSVADVQALPPRDLVALYFKLLPDQVQRQLIVTLAETKILRQRELDDGRMAVDIESNGMPSSILWTREGGTWKMDGEESFDAPR